MKQLLLFVFAMMALRLSAQYNVRAIIKFDSDSVTTEPEFKNLDSLLQAMKIIKVINKNELMSLAVVRIQISASGRYITHEVLRSVDIVSRTLLDKHLPKIRFSPAKKGTRKIGGWIRLHLIFQYYHDKSSYQKKYRYVAMESYTPQHKKIAILPLIGVASFSRKVWEQLSLKQSDSLREAYCAAFRKKVDLQLRSNPLLSVRVMPLDSVDFILAKHNITPYTISSYSYKQLGELLGVDAVIDGYYCDESYVTQSVATGVLIGSIAVSAAAMVLTGGLGGLIVSPATAGWFTSLHVIDCKSEIVLWRTDNALVLHSSYNSPEYNENRFLTKITENNPYLKQPVYVNNRLAQFTARHKKIAILPVSYQHKWSPIETTMYAKAARDSAFAQESAIVKQAYDAYMKKSKSWGIAVVDLATVTQVLRENHLSTDSLAAYKPSYLSQILGVDAIVYAECIGLNNGGYTPNSTVSVSTMQTTFTLYDGMDYEGMPNLMLWQANHTLEVTKKQPFESLLPVLMNKMADAFPY